MQSHWKLGLSQINLVGDTIWSITLSNVLKALQYLIFTMFLGDECSYYLHFFRGENQHTGTLSSLHNMICVTGKARIGNGGICALKILGNRRFQKLVIQRQQLSWIQPNLTFQDFFWLKSVGSLRGKWGPGLSTTFPRRTYSDRSPVPNSRCPKEAVTIFLIIW